MIKGIALPWLLRGALFLAAINLDAAVQLSAQPATPAAPPHIAEASAVVPELMTIVEQHGWRANVSRFCELVKLRGDSECEFKQIAVSGSEPGTIDNHAFNVPVRQNHSAPYAVMFHLGPLIGNFFVVAPEGKLKSAFYRAKGVDYTQIPNEEAGGAFAASISFWRQNMPKLKEMIASGNIPRR